ncbi:type II toxin-antitoxin system RelE/ParE family toxin [Flavobacterium sp. DG1-102-2]|uniref:type II toxin-antitoxin system RelE/ParE family toxin n=1 Tax=Flavobacterium sp. DG1-102-2 TaxID=3081663 RepID=UPI002949C825|nr:type II toxin-antitoxin system RelE/ParE family toxin [Flavobacterium sp. DG1-102-2]MDV6168270.1 type II toxin-antitoxin system RelE/ParE family toxin [Flavobacterium sp. DG1-102-2]
MRKVVLSDLAQRKLNILLDYLEDEWSITVANNFEANFEEKLLYISSYPESCIESGIFKNIRKCIVTKQTSFLYRIKNEYIEIITVFDNRSSFKSITKEIRKYYGHL